MSREAEEEVGERAECIEGRCGVFLQSTVLSVGQETRQSGPTET